MSRIRCSCCDVMKASRTMIMRRWERGSDTDVAICRSCSTGMDQSDVKTVTEYIELEGTLEREMEEGAMDFLARVEGILDE